MEQIDGDGYVNETDLLIVLFNYGSYIWTYDYDVWGNLTRASSPCVGTYEAGYDALGRRVWQEIDDVRTYFLYDGDTLIAEVAQVDNEWQLIAEYIWGPLGPLMMRRYNPQTQSWYNHSNVQDGLGHTRLLLDGNGNVINRYAYDAWGNLIEYEENVPNPFTWNGAYGYEWIAITGLYHIGAREYDPRTARWLQRDPIEASSGDPNFWRYCGNDPVNAVDPSGLVPTYFAVRLITDPVTGLIYLRTGDIIPEGAALQRRINGKDVLVRDDSLEKAQRAAKDLEKKVARELGGKIVGPEIHVGNPKAIAPAPHFHTELPNGTRHAGHTLYRAYGHSRISHTLRGGSRALGIFALGLGMFNIANAAADPCGKLGETVGGELGSIIGSGIGAAIGSAILPGAGTIIGGFLGGLAGGKIGEWVGGFFD